MNGQEQTGRRSPATWTDIRKKLAQTDVDYVIGIVKMLFDFSKENRTFLASRLFPETDWADLLKQCRKQIKEAVFPDRPRQLRLGDARKVITAYRKATSDVAGTVELMLVFVENGTECAHSYGIDYESFYDSLISMLNSLLKMLLDERNSHLLKRYRGRLRDLAEEASDCGWGYGDYVSERLTEAGLLDDEDEEIDGPAAPNAGPVE